MSATPFRDTKTTSDVLDYEVGFARVKSPFLLTGEVIQSAQVVEPTGEVGISGVTNTGSSVVFYIGSGVTGATYQVAVLIETSLGRKLARSLEIVIEDRLYVGT